VTASTGVAPDRAAEASETTRPEAARMRSLQMSVRRELWQSRAIVIGPLTAGVVLVASFLFGTIAAPERVSRLLALAADARHDAIARPYGFVAAMVALGALMVGVFYCLESLQSERSDRSILFWKSLPVSDATTVLAKACIPFAVLPILVFAVTLGVQAVMLLASTLALIATGGDPAALWRELPLLEMPVVLLNGIGAMTVVQAPLYAWLLMVSAWAPRRAVLWAFLPWLGIGAAEQMVFGQQRRFQDLVRHVIFDPFARAFAVDPTSATPPQVIDRIALLDPAAFLGRPGVLIGLGLTAAFLFIAIRLRRDRELT
jgi:ABC-2 type transport system permease protein